MQVIKIFITGMLCACTLLSFAQTATVLGTVKSKQGESLPGAAVMIKGTSKGTFSDPDGHFLLDKLDLGPWTLSVTFIGYETVSKEITLKEGEKLKVFFSLVPTTRELESVSVIGMSETREASKLAFNITAIDVKQLHNTTMDLSNVLDRVSGVRVRETGGVGSSFNFSLNGFTGKQVKFFMDGIPMDNFGSSFQLNNLPVNLADRVEVYKGVVPIWLGADALGGAVNIVTNPNRRNYLDASYSFGSFNTHKTAVNTGITTASGFTFQLNAFQNYSDNNYWVNVDVVPDLTTGLSVPMRVRRFHDTYRNETVIATAGIVNRKIADRLLFGITLGQNKADIQTGNRMYDVFGQRRREGNIVMPSIKYSKKNIAVKGLDLSFSGNFNFGRELSIDTAYRQYNWLGDFVYKGSNTNIKGGELSRNLYRYRNNNGLFNANLSYQLSEKHSLVINNAFNTFNRKGEDLLNPDDEATRQPRKTDKNVVGLGYRYEVNARWNTTLFAKEYIQKSKSSALLNNEYFTENNKYSRQGYGAAATYFLLPRLQLKASYEKSYRLPENDELFGDVINLASNTSLRPESSNNLNFGVNYTKSIHKVHHFYVDGNLIYRSAQDFIRPTLSTTNGLAVQRMVNLRSVTNSGIDAEIRYSYKRLLSAGVNMTYQNIRNNTKYEGSATVSPVYKDRIPNMPYLFGNANASLFFQHIGAESNTLTLGYNLLYVHEYYLRWPSQGTAGSKLTIPEQLAHDVSVVYSIANGRYNIAFECRNLTDATLYDNFSLQKPSRSFNVKLRYFIQQ
jgi:outer membrane receptor protein involved in Fe transport